MNGLLVLVEGQTEETFCDDLLRPHLTSRGFISVAARLMGNARLRTNRGGVRGWQDVRKDIVRHLRQDFGAVVTTMVDFYGMPHGANSQNAWPGRADAERLPFEQRGPFVEAAIAADVCGAMGQDWRPDQFVAFVLMHEFESLLFSDCAAFAAGIGKPESEADFSAIRNQFRTPEEINDSPQTHPSQRIIDIVPGYQKPLQGVLAALEIGLDPMREECHHFRGWLERLETIVTPSP